MSFSTAFHSSLRLALKGKTKWKNVGKDLIVI